MFFLLCTKTRYIFPVQALPVIDSVSMTVCAANKFEFSWPSIRKTGKLTSGTALEFSSENNNKSHPFILIIYVLLSNNQLWVRTSNWSGPLTTENMIPAPETLAHKGTFKESKNMLTTLSSGSRD